MSRINVYVNRSWNGSAIAKATRFMGNGCMRLVIPEYVVLENNGFSSVEQRDIVLGLVKIQEEILEKVQRNTCSVTLEI